MNKNTFSLSLFSIIILFLSGCKDDPSFLGRNLLPSGDDINVKIDSSTVIKGYTVSLDNVKISGKAIGLVGAYDDPFFGTSEAGFMVQLEPSEAVYYLEKSFTVDSVVLKLRYDNVFGDKNFTNDVKVYEIIRDLSRDATYYTDFDYPSYYYGALNIAQNMYYTSEEVRRDSIVVDKITGKVIDTLEDFIFVDSIDFINFSLPKALAQKLLAADSVDFSSRDNFVNYFKGLYIGPGASGNSIFYMNYATPDNFDKFSRISVNFKDTSAHTFNYIITANSARVNLFENNYSGYPINEALNDTITERNVLYIQAMSGASGLIKLDLDNWMDSSYIAVNKAELVIKPETTMYPDKNLYPEKLRLFALKDDYESFSPDYFYYLSDGDLYATYDSDKKEYAFNITLHVQRIVKGDVENRPLIIIAGSNTISANRVIVKNGSNPDPMKLRIYYTKLSL